MKLSILFPETRSVERAIARIEQLERLGFHSAVMGHAMDFDPIAVFALAGARTERILLTTAVVPLFSRHPISLAMSAATAQAASRGRFRLGIGPSHQPVVEHVYGLAGHRPRVLAAGRTTLRLIGLVKPEMREYLHTLYQFTDPWIVDDSKFRGAFGATATPARTALATTLAWYRDRTGANAA